MAGAVDGLVSGLDTSTIITQLMQLERGSQDRLKTQKSETESGIAALRTLNTRFLSLSTAAKSLTLSSGWNAATATSSDSARVTATAKPGALSGEVSFVVKHLASAEVWKSSGAVASTDTAVATAGSTFTITKDGTAKSVAVADGSLAGVVTAINGASAGVTATAVQVSPGAFVLQLTSTTPGSTALTVDSSAFSAELGTVTQLTAGVDAKLQVGVAADGTGGYEVTRKTNTFDDLLKGTTISLLAQNSATPVTVRASGDSAAVADGVAKMVDGINAVLTEIARTGSYDATARKGGVLHGDGAVRGLRSQLALAVMGSSATTPSIAGISVQRDGSIAFDRATFLEALAADPEGVKARIGGGTPETVVDGTVVPAVAGLANRLAAVADAASRGKGSDGGAGIVTSAIANRERSILQITADIGRWDSRLKLREERLVTQFASLEKALGAAQSQGQWLAGQIAGLPSWS